MTTKECEICGKTFSSAKKNPRFCSMDCRLKDREKNRIYMSCDYCHKTFYLPKNLYEKKIKNNQTKFCCSKECRIKSEQHNIEDIKKEFSEKDYTLLSETYGKAKDYLYYICNKHKDKGILKITYDNFKSGFGCKFCGDDRTREARRNDFDKVKDVFLKHDMLLIEDQIYKNSSQKLKYICIHHKEKGIQEMSCSNALKNYCPFCNIKKGELSISNYLDNQNVNYEFQKRFKDLLSNKNGHLSYDFYLPDYNLLIEYQGQQHYYPVDFFGGEEQFAIQKTHDEQKRKYAKDNNYKLLEIPYTEFDNINDILDNYINTKILRDCGDSCDNI